MNIAGRFVLGLKRFFGVGRPLPPGRDLGDQAWRDVEFGAGARNFTAEDPTRDPGRHPNELVIDPEDLVDGGERNDPSDSGGT
jgi:hypothetical protein